VWALLKKLLAAQELRTNDFDGIATRDEFWFPNISVSSKIFAHSGANVISRRRQDFSAKEPRITPLLTARKLIALNVMPKRRKYNQL
jgi:hypothetical protein